MHRIFLKKFHSSFCSVVNESKSVFELAGGHGETRKHRLDSLNYQIGHIVYVLLSRFLFRKTQWRGRYLGYVIIEITQNTTIIQLSCIVFIKTIGRFNKNCLNHNKCFFPPVVIIRHFVFINTAVAIWNTWQIILWTVTYIPRW